MEDITFFEKPVCANDAKREVILYTTGQSLSCDEQKKGSR